ncbi:MAG TPA: endo alpha-1,4 polygalactosaminidase, partial [Polyangiaceae bacterium]|nr:endo alpha-1,4 polygalactosaminidase [Polyangiaceae bacterium]
DADQFPAEVIGNDYDGWPGEKYLDIRADAVKTRMLARFDTCRAQGFDAIEPDNMDVFELGGESGFPLTRADGVSYAKWLAQAAHDRGMAIGQKNASSITADIEAEYDWALTESCYSDGDWCGDVKAYATHDKPVFMCEYEQGSFSAACSAWQGKGYSPILKDMDLAAPVTFCP